MFAWIALERLVYTQIRSYRIRLGLNARVRVQQANKKTIPPKQKTPVTKKPNPIEARHLPPDTLVVRSEELAEAIFRERKANHALREFVAHLAGVATRRCPSAYRWNDWYKSSKCSIVIVADQDNKDDNCKKCWRLALKHFEEDKADNG